MKGITALIVLLFCLFTFIPLIFLLCDMIVNGRGSLLNSLIDTLNE